MRRFTWVGPSLAGLAIAEIAVLVLAVKAFGVGVTLLALLATTMLGGWLLRREGALAWRRFRQARLDRRPPGVEASRGLVGLLAALLLVLPGFITDLAGLLLLLPPVRAGVVRLVQRSAERRLPPAAAGDLFGPRRVRSHPGPYAHRPPSNDGGQVVEGEIVD